MQRNFFMTENEKIINWLKSRDLISINALEKKCGLAQGTISKVLNRKENRNLNEKHIPILRETLKLYGFE
jgi:hypothetical protein